MTRRILVCNDAVRPAETALDRLYWLIAHDAHLLDRELEAVDYRGQVTGTVFEDIAAVVPGTVLVDESDR